MSFRNNPNDDGSLLPDDPSGGLSRRQIVRAAAWAAPVIVLATAAPAAVASGEGNFADYFNWGTPSLNVGHNAIQLPHAALQYIGTGSIIGSISVLASPPLGAANAWVSEIDTPPQRKLRAFRRQRQAVGRLPNPHG